MAAFPRTSRRRRCRSARWVGIRFVSENDDAATPCDEKWRVRVKSPEWNAWIGLARGACHGTGIDSKWWITEHGRFASSLGMFALWRLSSSPSPLCFVRHSDVFYQHVLSLFHLSLPSCSRQDFSCLRDKVKYMRVYIWKFQRDIYRRREIHKLWTANMFNKNFSQSVFNIHFLW